jgi:lathosterol oxidase
MDAILEVLDPYVFDGMYAYLLPQQIGLNGTGMASSFDGADMKSAVISAWPRDHLYRQCSSILIIAGLGAASLYFIFASLSYFLLYDRRLEHHPRFLQNQISKEIRSSLIAIPFIDIFTLPFFLGEVRGKSLLYSNIDEYGWSWLLVSTILYLLWNDIGIYWIHRLEHHPSVYRFVHKPHHKWIIPTPFAALAFHPVDGYLQSLPYHIFVFICPMQKHLYLVLFATVQLWTVFIHDGDMIAGHWLQNYLSSPAHHTLHHMYFTVNYGQYFTWTDSYFGSHREPTEEQDPIHDAIKAMQAKGLADKDGNPIPRKAKGE